nr:hypothetical protein [Eikenella sp. Marseille-P7795]
MAKRPPCLHAQDAAAGVKIERGTARGDETVDHEGGGERGVSAQVDFTFGREPAQGEGVALRYDEGSFGKVVFLGDIAHQIFGRECVRHADGGGIAAEHAVGKGIYGVLFDGLHSSFSVFQMALQAACFRMGGVQYSGFVAGLGGILHPKSCAAAYRPKGYLKIPKPSEIQFRRPFFRYRESTKLSLQR